jgi:hypothetical protein
MPVYPSARLLQKGQDRPAPSSSALQIILMDNKQHQFCYFSWVHKVPPKEMTRED